MNVAFIVNPAAGHGRARRVWQRVAAALRERGYTYQAYFTAGPGHATELARQAAQRHEVIAAVGGDGTAHQVLAGLIGSGRELAVVPAGTANDYCRSAGIPLDPVAAALALNQHRVRRVDYGWVGAEPFLNVAGIGLDAAVCRALEDHWRFLPGKLGYVAAVLENLVRLRPTRVELSLDGRRLMREVVLVAVAKGRAFGGGMLVAPAARLDDGRFQVVVVGALSRSEFLRFFPLVYTGRHVEHPAVEVFSAQRVEIVSSRPLPVQAEGELLGTTPASFRLAAGALPLCTGDTPAETGADT